MQRFERDECELFELVLVDVPKCFLSPSLFELYFCLFIELILLEF